MRHKLVVAMALTALLTAYPTAPAAAQAVADHPKLTEALRLLDAWIDAQVAYGQIPGASAAVVHDQELVWSAGYGFANREDRVPATPATRYSICSISKLFTSIAVLQLRDAGKLRLDDAVSSHLPWFAIQNVHSEAGEPTIASILTHSSGLPRESDHPYWTGPEFEFPTREQVMERVSHQQTLYPADTYFQYSNLGLTLAGEVAAAVSGTPYGDLIRTRVLEPLGMASTTTEIPARLWGDELAVGYGAIDRHGERARVPLFQARGIAPAAGFSSTVEDLARFASWQFRTLEGNGDGVLSPNTLREMHRVHWVDPDFETHWGLGFSTWRSSDKTFVGHGGSCPGYRSHVALQTGDRIATVFAANALGVNPNLYTSRAYEIVAPAIREAAKTAKATASSGLAGDGSASSGGAAASAGAERQEPDLAPYLGTYGASFGGEILMLAWDGQLASVNFPTSDPLGSLTKLRHVEGHTFRRIRDDGELGEEFTFEVADGRAARFIRNSNRYERVR